MLPTSPRQVRVLQCALLSPGLSLRADTDAAKTLLASSGFDLLPYIQKIDIYESIFENTISGTITLLENIGLTEYLPIIGVETIGLVFQIDKPGDEQAVMTFARTFRVVGLKNQAFPRHDYRLYELHLATPEFVQSVSSRVCRAFHDTSCVNAVVDVLNNDLGVTKIDVEDTFGKIDVVIPNYTPLQAINYFTVLAQTKQKQESNFLFYETMASGFHFRSISALITAGSTGKVASFNVDGGRITVADTITQAEAQRNIIRVHQTQGFDLLFDIASGMLRSRLVPFDFVARKPPIPTDSRYTKTFAKTTHLDKYPVYPRNFDLSVAKNVRLFMVPSNVWSSKSAYIDSIENQPVQRLHEAIVLRNRQLKEIRHVETLLDLPGQPDLQAGTVVDVFYPSSRALQGKDVSINTPLDPKATPYYSGKHLVTSVHHILLTKEPGSMEYRMNIKVNRDSFGSPLMGTTDTDET
jgi:hypothetical protein